jgi:hypothetical protein
MQPGHPLAAWKITRGKNTAIDFHKVRLWRKLATQHRYKCVLQFFLKYCISQVIVKREIDINCSLISD